MDAKIGSLVDWAGMLDKFLASLIEYLVELIAAFLYDLLGLEA